MSIKFTKLSKILVIATIISLFSVETRAQTNSELASDDNNISLNQAFKEVYFEHTGDAFKNAGFLAQLNNIIGIQWFPEKQIALDAKLVDILYQDAMRQQANSGIAVRTDDLPNPYSTSLRENPDYFGR